MLVVTSFDDLIKYLETRKKFSERQLSLSKGKTDPHATGMIFAFEESIRAVQALNTYMEAREQEETPLVPAIDSENSPTT